VSESGVDPSVVRPNPHLSTNCSVARAPG
jgi:hypothetical protein